METTNNILATASANVSANINAGNIAINAQERINLSPETPEHKSEVQDAIKSLKAALSAIKAEVLSPRAICRAIRETMATNATIAAFAARIGITPNSSKKVIDNTAVPALLKLIPYYIETRLSVSQDKVDSVVSVAIMQSTSKDGVFVARECKDIFVLVEQAMSNDNGVHYEVKPGGFYRLGPSGKPEETEKCTISKATKTAAEKRAERLAKVLEESKGKDILAALIDKYGIDNVKRMLGD